jgi:ribosomal protein S21
MGIKITPRHNEPLVKALKRLKRTLQKEGQQRELMRHRYHETESVRRRRRPRKSAKPAHTRAPQIG